MFILQNTEKKERRKLLQEIIRNRGIGKGERGSATVEACIVVPLFLLFLQALIYVIFILFAEAHIHQSLAEAMEIVAQEGYLECRLAESSQKDTGAFGALLQSKRLVSEFGSILDEDTHVEHMVIGGKQGIRITLKADEENPKILIGRADYQVGIYLPVFGSFGIRLSNTVRQKAYVGYSKEECVEEYVYVTPNEAVYHTKRSCSHLSLSVRSCSYKNHTGKNPCSFCGNGKGDVIYVTRTTDTYHLNPDCLGLKRTVIRKKRSEVGYLSPCSRCGRKEK